MASITKLVPSGSTDGKPVQVTETATPGVIFHTAHATLIDEIYLWLTSRHTADVEVTIEFGGVTAAENIKFTIPAKETILALAGVPLTNSLVARLFASVDDVISGFGHVNRIDQS
jgi:hypothetical protein